MHFTFTVGHERVELYLYSPYGLYGLYRASVPVQGVHFTFTVGHERVELYLYSPYGLNGLYRASVPVQGCTLPFPFTKHLNYTSKLEYPNVKFIQSSTLR